MTTESDFQAALDLNPDDAMLRLVFADFLDDQGDPRGPGYRALGANNLIPRLYTSGPKWGWPRYYEPPTLPIDWYDLLPGRIDSFHGVMADAHDSRRKCEDITALAFARLPPARQAELLGQVEAAT